MTISYRENRADLRLLKIGSEYSGFAKVKSKAAVLTVTLFLVTGVTYAQQFELQLSVKHIQKIEQTKDPAGKLKKYRKYYSKDSLKQVKEWERYWQIKTDSLSNIIEASEKAIERKQRKIKDNVNSKVYNTIYKPWAKKNALRELKWLEKHHYNISPTLRIILYQCLTDHFLEVSQKEKMLFNLKQREPSLKLPKQLTQKFNNYKALYDRRVLASKLMNNMDDFAALQNKATSYASKIKASTSQGFSEKQIMNQARKIQGFAELDKARGELDQLKKMSNQYRGQLEQLQDSAYRKEQAKKKAEELAMNYIASNPAMMQKIQKKMSLLMKKYSIVPNSNDLSSAVKQTSLKGKSFKERLYLAGNFQILSFEPFSADFSPMAGYRFNRKFLAGVGLNYRQSFRDTIPSFSPDVFGYKAFSSYDVMSNFFAYAEFDRNSTGLKKVETQTELTWKNAAFLGVGRKFKVSHKIEMTIVMMYNFLREHPDPIYPKPWNVRVGFQTSELAMFRKKPDY